MPELYCLVRQGTNVRVLNRDDQPVITDKTHITDLHAHYENIMKTELEVLSLDEYATRYTLPSRKAHEKAKRLAYKAAEAEATE